MKMDDPLCGGGAGSSEGCAVLPEVPEVGRLVDSSQADDRRMIRLVRARRLLYARTNMPVASYYAQVKRLWQEVADEMGWTVADVRRKWSHIRNSYSRHLRNELHGVRTGKGRVVSRWYLADELAFLREHMATDTRASPYMYGNSLVKLEQSPTHTHDAGVDLKPFMGSPWLTMAVPPPPAAPPSFDPEDSSHSQAFSSDENSSYFQFFRGLHGEYQELTARRQRQFKRQCLSLLHQLLDEEDASASGDAITLCHSQYDSDDERDRKPQILIDRTEQIISSD